MSNWKIIQSPTSDITNLCTNPSFEAGTAGWTPGSGNTFSWPVPSGKSYRGLYALGCDHGSGTVMASYAISGLTSGGTVFISAWTYIQDWSNFGTVRMSGTNFTGATNTYNYTLDATDSTSSAAWHYLETKLVLSTDTAGSVVLETTSNPSGGIGVNFWLDMVTITETSGAVTVFDGDTEGCYWTGAEHASTSVAPSGIRNVGVEYDLEDDLNFRVLQAIGMGMPKSRHVVEQTSGGNYVYNESQEQPRVLTLVGNLQSTTEAGFHSLRRDILDLIYPNRDREKYYLRYYGSNSEKPIEIECVYDGGFEGNTISANTETIDWRSIAYAPFWKELPQQKESLTTRGTVTVDQVVWKLSGDWGSNRVNYPTAPYSMLYDKSTDLLYVGNTTGVKKYDGSNWGTVGGTANNQIWALALDPAGNLYAGGAFTYIGGGTANYVAKWNGSAWSALGTGTNGIVRALAIDRAGTVYAGGWFTTAGGGTVNYVAKWNGSAWSDMDTGVGGSVYALEVDRANNVYVGGKFTVAGSSGGTVNNVTKWNGTSFETMSTGTNNTVYVLEKDEAGNIYAGGDFTTASGASVNHIALWAGAGWYALDEGVNDFVYALKAAPNGLLYAGGEFTSASGLTLTDRVAAWNGSSWVHLDVDLPGTVPVWSIESRNNKLYDDIYIGFNIGGSSGGTAYASADTTITNTSSAKTYPIFEVRNEGASQTLVTYLKNETTGATVWLNYNLQPDEKLTIDFEPNNYSVTSSLFGDASEAILGGSDENFYLRPGSNIITCFTPNAGVTGALYWRRSHWDVAGVAA